MRFEFATARRILFGPGALQEAAPAAATLGRRALVVTGGSVERAAPLIAQLKAHGVEATTFAVAGEPTMATILAGLERAKELACDLVIGLGGGSVLDSGKAIAALLTNGGHLLDYLQVIGRGQALAGAAGPGTGLPT